MGTDKTLLVAVFATSYANVFVSFDILYNLAAMLFVEPDTKSLRA